MFNTEEDISIHSFNTLYHSYYKNAFLFVKSYVHDFVAAEDIASESLILLWKILKQEQPRSVKALLLTILKNKSLNWLKHQSIKFEAGSYMQNMYTQELNIRISTLEICNPETIFTTEVNEIVQRTLITLPEQTRKIFEMSRFENKSNKEIAEIFNITVKGVDYHIAKALKSLRISLKDYLSVFYFLLFYH